MKKILTTAAILGSVLLCQSAETVMPKSEIIEKSALYSLPCGDYDGDGNNDVLYVRGNNIKTVVFKIYNRGGQQIFQSNRLEVGWDGTFKGQLQRMDAYVYYLNVTFDNGTSVQKRGEVTLVN